MPDLPIVIPDTAVAPKDYTLSGTQELALKTVRALIDGSGAASAFLPTLQLLDPNGHVMWEGATSETVAAGGSADVSWFPGLGGTGGASTTNAEWFEATRVGSQTMLAGARDTVIFTGLKSSDPSLFSLATQNHPNDAVQVAREGVVLASAYTLPGALEPNFVLGININAVGPGVTGANSQVPDIEFNTLGMAGGSTFGPRDIAFVVPDAVPWKLIARYHNFDAVNRTLSESQLSGFWWPTGVFFS